MFNYKMVTRKNTGEVKTNLLGRKIDWGNLDDVKKYNKIRGKIYYEKNKEKESIRKKKYREENLESLKIREKKYREKNKEKESIRGRKYREDNKEKERIRHKEYNDNNPEIRKKYYERNKEKIKSNSEQHYKENKDEISIQSKQRYEKNREKNREIGKKYYQKNKDKIVVQNKKYRKINKDKIKIKRKKYYEKNKDEISIYNKQRHENNKKNICIICGNPASIKYCSDECQGIGMSGENSSRWNGGHKIYSVEWNNKFKKMIRDRDNNKCMRCGRAREEFNRALDVHHIDANPQNTTKENCITLCIPCHNLTKNKGEFFNEGFRNMLKRLYGYVYENENNVDKSKLKIVRKEVK